MKDQAQQELKQIQDQLTFLEYDTNLRTDKTALILSAVGRNSLSVKYSEEGERSGYSRYDMSLIVEVDGQSFIYLLSERTEEEFVADFKKVSSLIKAINDKAYDLIEESSIIFWKRQYLKVEYEGDSLYLLKTK